MAIENEEDFLQDISLAEEEEYGEDEYTKEELELDALRVELEALRVERDDLKDKWMRALAALSWLVIFCLCMTTSSVA